MSYYFFKHGTFCLRVFQIISFSVIKNPLPINFVAEKKSWRLKRDNLQDNLDTSESTVTHSLQWKRVPGKGTSKFSISVSNHVIITHQMSTDNCHDKNYWAKNFYWGTNFRVSQWNKDSDIN